MRYPVNSILSEYLRVDGKVNIWIAALYAIAILQLTTCYSVPAKESSKYSESIRILAREQSLAEGYANLLKEYGKKTPEKYARGIELYVKAKAEYDGLIEQMRYHLTKGQPLDEKGEYGQIIKNAADQRIAFTNFVSDEIIGKEQGRRFPVPVFTTVKELASVLVDVGKAIWEEYHKAVTQEKQEILTQLNSLKWKSFDKIGSGG